MHILCRDLSAASRLLHLATASGYRESGISISALGTPQEKVLAAIRTTAIRLDVPLACYFGENGAIRPFGLTREYLVNLFNLINNKFEENELRKLKLFKSLQDSFSIPQSASSNETKDQRRVRKREDGLKLQTAKNQMPHNKMSDQESGAKDVLDDNMSLDHLATI
jgi:tRNA wybutosine-synthesizing protein 3